MRPTRGAAAAAAVLAGWWATAPLVHAQPAPPPPPEPAPAEAPGPAPAEAPGSAPTEGPEPAPTEAPGSAPTEGPEPAPADGLETTIDGDGSYAVGVDIAPGAYQSAGPVDDGACYWKRTAGDELVDNALTKKPAFVQILPSDTTFYTTDCQTWTLTDALPPPQPGPGDLLGQLTALIGSGILAGGPP